MISTMRVTLEFFGTGKLCFNLSAVEFNTFAIVDRTLSKKFDRFSFYSRYTYTVCLHTGSPHFSNAFGSGAVDFNRLY